MNRLATGDRQPFKVDARELWNSSECIVERDARYRLEVVEDASWVDWIVPASPAKGWLGPARLIEPVARLRARARSLPMYCLVGAIGRDPATFFCAASPSSWLASHTGPLDCFANDWPTRYGNNRGLLRVVLHRVA